MSDENEKVSLIIIKITKAISMSFTALDQGNVSECRDR